MARFDEEVVGSSRRSGRRKMVTKAPGKKARMKMTRKRTVLVRFV